MLRIMAEIACSKFQRQTLMDYSGMNISDEDEQFIRDKALVLYRFDIEIDSTIRADMQRNQEQWNNFLNGTAQFFTAMAPAIQAIPKMAPGLIRVFGAFVRRQRLGKEAEDELDRMVEAAEDVAENGVPGQESGPSPEEIAMQQQAHDQQMQVMQADQQRAHDQQAMLTEKHQMDMQLKQFELQSRQELAQLDMQIKQQAAEINAASSERDMQVGDAKAQAELTKAQMASAQSEQQFAIDQARSDMDAEAMQRKAAFDVHAMQLKAAGDSNKIAAAERMAKIKEAAAKAQAKARPRTREPA
jgi:hypothetical protein